MLSVLIHLEVTNAAVRLDTTRRMAKNVLKVCPVNTSKKTRKTYIKTFYRQIWLEEGFENKLIKFYVLESKSKNSNGKKGIWIYF